MSTTFLLPKNLILSEKLDNATEKYTLRQFSEIWLQNHMDRSKILKI